MGWDIRTECLAAGGVGRQVGEAWAAAAGRTWRARDAGWTPASGTEDVRFSRRDKGRGQGPMGILPHGQTAWFRSGRSSPRND